MNAEVLPPIERQIMVRRLLGLCHIVDDLVAHTEAAPCDDTESAAALREQVHRIRAVLRDTVVDLVANGHAYSCGAA